MEAVNLNNLKCKYYLLGKPRVLEVKDDANWRTPFISIRQWSLGDSRWGKEDRKMRRPFINKNVLTYDNNLNAFFHVLLVSIIRKWHNFRIKQKKWFCTLKTGFKKNKLEYF